MFALLPIKNIQSAMTRELHGIAPARRRIQKCCGQRVPECQNWPWKELKKILRVLLYSYKKPRFRGICIVKITWKRASVNENVFLENTDISVSWSMCTEKLLKKYEFSAHIQKMNKGGKICLICLKKRISCAIIQITLRTL